MVWPSVAKRGKTGANRAKLVLLQPDWLRKWHEKFKGNQNAEEKKANQITHSRWRELVIDAKLREKTSPLIQPIEIKHNRAVYKAYLSLLAVKWCLLYVAHDNRPLSNGARTKERSRGYGDKLTFSFVCTKEIAD